jgi:hypothetical protein
MLIDSHPKLSPRTYITGTASELFAYFEIEGATQKNKFGFKFTQNRKNPSSLGEELHYMSIMSLEVHGISLLDSHSCSEYTCSATSQPRRGWH